MNGKEIKRQESEREREVLISHCLLMFFSLYLVRFHTDYRIGSSSASVLKKRTFYCCLSLSLSLSHLDGWAKIKMSSSPS